MTGNSQTTAKKPKPKGKGRPFVKGDPRINREGAPRKSMSWKELLDEIGSLDGAQALERAGRIFADLRKYPGGVTLKELSAISFYIKMINDPAASMLNAVADRTEGKVPDRVQHEGTLQVENLVTILQKVYGKDGSSDPNSR